MPACGRIGTQVRERSILGADRSQVPSPGLVLDLDVFESNLAAAERMVAGSGKLLRPHVKTHRTPELAIRQLGRVARGVTCATVGEAEAMVEAGIGDVLLANEIVSPAKVARMATLARRAHVTLVVDAAEVVPGLSEAAQRERVTFDVLVDVDVGLGRCGVRTPGEACSLARMMEGVDGLRFAGIMGYEGRVRRSRPQRERYVSGAVDALAMVAAELEAASIPVETVSAGGTSTLKEMLADPIVTEIQAGTYAIMEDDLEGLGLPFRPALSVISTVISRSGSTAVLDAGRKTVGCDSGLPRPLDDRAEALTVSEEHLALEWDGDPPALGSRVGLRPSHVRTTFNLHDVVWLVRQGVVVGRVPVAARGMSQ